MRSSHASRNGDFERLLALLDPDAVVLADAAAVRMGSDALVTGAQAVAETFAGRARAARPAAHRRRRRVRPGCTRADRRSPSGSPSSTGRITEIELLADPDVLGPARVQLV